MSTDKIVDEETVQVTTVMSSKAMEERRLQKDPIDRMKARKVPVKVFCTDCHQGIQKIITCTLVPCVVIQEPQ